MCGSFFFFFHFNSFVNRQIIIPYNANVWNILLLFRSLAAHSQTANETKMICLLFEYIILSGQTCQFVLTYYYIYANELMNLMCIRVFVCMRVFVGLARVPVNRKIVEIPDRGVMYNLR